MEKPVKHISRVMYLKAFALFTVANINFVKAKDFEDELCSLLGVKDDYLGHISDEIYEKKPNFDKALENEGYVVTKPLRKSRK